MSRIFQLATIAGALALGAIPPPAIADRHCAPVLEAYYVARSAVRHETQNCEAAMQDALRSLLDAGQQAGVCGCRSLQDTISGWASELTRPGASCSERKAALLALDNDLPGLVEACQ